MGIFWGIAGKTASQEARRANISASVDRLYLRKWGEKKIVDTSRKAIRKRSFLRPDGSKRHPSGCRAEELIDISSCRRHVRGIVLRLPPGNPVGRLL